MMPRKYVRGLPADDVDVPGVYGTPHSRIPGSWRILASYDDGKRHKERLFRHLAAEGQSESRRTWEWHHVVEGQHFAEIDFGGRLAQLYANELPCVLIAKEEHLAYNRLLHIRETDELFRDRGLPDDVRRRSAETAADARISARHPELRARVAHLRALYRNAYAGDRVLTTVAENVLDDALAQLR